MKGLTTLSVFLFLLSSTLFGQESNVSINKEGKDFQNLKHAWKAQWITHPSASTMDYGVFHFRQNFELEKTPEEFIIHISADNRYRLYVNGNYITYGPAIGDIDHYRYESIDINSYLHPGKNVIAAEVVNFGEYRRAAQQSFQTAFILQAECEEFPDLNINTGSSPWKVLKNEAYTNIPFTSDSLGAYYAAGPGESLDFSLHPWGWEQADFDDSSWKDPKAGTVEFAVGRGFLYGSTWFLVPREIPLMEEHEERFNNIARSQGLTSVSSFIHKDSSLSIPPDSKVSILIDNKFHTTGFPVLKLSKGQDASMKISYAEALHLPWSSGELNNNGHYDAVDRKRDRNDLEGKVLEGYYDLVFPDGGEERIFSPLSRKTFRFVQFDIQTRDEGLIIEDFYNNYAGYPFEEKASFSSSDEHLLQIWDAAWLTLVNSSEEQFFDPYYEQLQYIGDTRIEALVSIYVSGDDRLMRKAIKQFDDSRLPNGLTQSRYPSYIVQVIPPYSLLWIGMIHDYFMYRNDENFVKQFIPGMLTVLDWFANRVDSTGMATDLGWWNFTDWSKGFSNGIPPGADDGYSANINLQFVTALQQSSEIMKHFNLDQDAEKYGALARRIQASVLDNCYHAERGLIAETPEQNSFSQHSNIWGILNNTLPEKNQKEVLQTILSDSTLIQATIYFKFYLFRALQKCGMGDLYLTQLEPWEKMLANNMSTYGEKDGIMRSECHGWSASPCFDFLHTVAGIYPLDPGFKTIAVAPNFGELESMEVSFPHPNGMLELNLTRKGDKVKGSIVMPENTKGEFSWNGTSILLSGGKNRIN